MNWTFAIPTDGKKNDFHPIIFDSIRKQHIPNYEILLATESPNLLYNDPDIREIYVEPLKPIWITKKKNECAKAARYDNVCFLHDYIKFDPGWFEGYEVFGCDWDVCMNSVFILDTDCRFFDWMLAGDLHPGWNPLTYDMIDRTKEMYVSGAYWCAKRQFMLDNPLNEDLTWGENEDGEWSKRVRDKWRLKFNPHSVVRTLKQK